MNKCPNCGTEFEGKFCPECGESISNTKICPRCGAECASGAKFCNMCGYSFAGTASQSAEDKPQTAKPPKPEAVYKKAHKVLGVVPVVTAFLFAVLAFVCMALPAVVTPAFEIMGEKIPSENLGSLFAAYAGKIEDVPIRGHAIAAVAAAAFAAAFALVLAVCNKNKRLKTYAAGFLSALKFLCSAAYIALIVISSVIMGTISATDEGTGLITAGAGVILLLVFSCLAFAVTLACAVADRFIVLKNFPQFGEIPERKPIAFSGIAPQKVEKPIMDIPLWQEKQLKTYAILERICYMGAVPQILLCVYNLWLFNLGILEEPSQFMATIISIFIIIIYIFIFISIILCFTVLQPKILNINLKKALIIVLMLLGLSTLVWGVVEIIFCIATLVYGKKVKKLLYIDKKQGILTDYGKDFVQRQNEYKAAIEQYGIYVTQLEEYNHEKEMCRTGYDYDNSTDRKLFWAHTHKFLLVLIAILIAALIALAVILPVTLPAPEPHDLDGTYYVYRNNGYEKDNYIVITGNHWEDDDGVNGWLERSDGTLSFRSIVFGVEDEVYSGERVSEGVLKLNVLGWDMYFCVDGKTPPDEKAASVKFAPRTVFEIP